MALGSTRVTPDSLVTIVAGSVSEDTPFMRMLSGRDRRTFTVRHNPHLSPGTWLYTEDGLGLIGRVTRVWDNEDADDWITGAATEWYVEFEKPWNQSNMQTTIGNAKIEWLEDTMMPRVGRVISCEPSSAFMLGDIIRLTH